MAALPIIIDTDPGQDDAVAILAALGSPDLEVVGITTVGGNVPLDLTTKNALILRDLDILHAMAQDDLVQAGKLSALGQMSAGISHELNQPLMAIRSFADNGSAFLARGKADKYYEYDEGDDGG